MAKTHFRTMLVLFASVLLAGCLATSPMSQGSDASAPQHAANVVKCEQPQQPGCWELRALNFHYAPAHPLMKGVDKPARSEQERQERVQFLGPQLWEEFRAGKVQSSAPRSFVIFMWNVKDVPSSHLQAYRVNGMNVMEKVPFSEIKDPKSYPVFDPSFDLGKPQKIFRVKAEGQSPVGASLQIPWAMVTDKTYFLICTEDKLTVYPNKVTANEGLWVAPQSLVWLRDTRKSTRGLLPFISKSEPSGSQKTAGK